MKECLNYLDSIVSYIKPKVGVYIAIDGVAPVAKIKQQKVEKFKSVSDRKLKENILKNIKGNQQNIFGIIVLLHQEQIL